MQYITINNIAAALEIFVFGYVAIAGILPSLYKAGRDTYQLHLERARRYYATESLGNETVAEPAPLSTPTAPESVEPSTDTNTEALGNEPVIGEDFGLGYYGPAGAPNIAFDSQEQYNPAAQLTSKIEQLSRHSIRELKKLATGTGIPRYSRLSKQELVVALASYGF